MIVLLGTLALSVPSSYGLVPVPLFIFMGYMCDRSGIATELMRAMQMALSRVPGGLVSSVTVIGVQLASTTGIIGALIVLLGTLALSVIVAFPALVTWLPSVAFR